VLPAIDAVLSIDTFLVSLPRPFGLVVVAELAPLIFSVRGETRFMRPACRRVRLGANLAGQAKHHLNFTPIDICIHVPHLRNQLENIKFWAINSVEGGLKSPQNLEFEYLVCQPSALNEITG
jgi:hypothetical protein